FPTRASKKARRCRITSQTVPGNEKLLGARLGLGNGIRGFLLFAPARRIFFKPSDEFFHTPLDGGLRFGGSNIADNLPAQWLGYCTEFACGDFRKFDVRDGGGRQK